MEGSDIQNSQNSAITAKIHSYTEQLKLEFESPMDKSLYHSKYTGHSY